MRIAATFFLLFALTCGALSAEENVPEYLPQDLEFREWMWSETPALYIGGGLFGYINGGAEIFHEYNFEELWLARYSDGGEGEITLEVYRMKTPEEAFGIFSVKRSGQEKNSPKISSINWVTAAQINLAKGPFYVNITAFDTPAGILEDFAGFVEAKIKGESAIPPLLSLFPRSHQAPNSGRFIQGQLAATAESILFGRNFWGFKTGTVAYSVRYLPSNSKAIILLFKTKISGIEELVQFLFEEYLEDVKTEGEIASGKNAVGNIFLFKSKGCKAVLIQGERNPVFAKTLLEKLLSRSIYPELLHK